MYNTVIIGAGQAGLAMAYHLKRLDQPFILLDRSEDIGGVWRSRYDSLTLFTPRMYSALPGLPLKGDPHGFPAKNEMAFYLKHYAEQFHFPVHLQTEVESVWKERDCFRIQTNGQTYEASSLIIASGPFQTPFIPNFAQKLSTDVLQMHSSQYKNPAGLSEGNVLVVGGGNSGAQIAVELSKTRKTYLSVSQKLRFLPLKIGKRSIFWWLDKTGVLDAPSDSWVARKIRSSGDPIFGSELKHALISGAVVQKSRTTGARGTVIQFQDGSTIEVQNIIWSTGFVSDYAWLKVKGVLNDKGHPVHQRGITPMKGLYFLGLPWQVRRGSALLQGVGEDARYIAEHIQECNEIVIPS
ncbi:NAD(P)/FAD-dependent oxidoreductase [Domibacillus sp. PGB-M46]|uniref:flavin-containing monooxygenase n=1 Tax=Domibacillus sp. PGB-M46 TaxID=2910255 RepID=UPI001F58A4FC|nr:NAD(P)/FAD-dependent oxidoreductase [Domibacillus sp. PGB-M46]MCI2257218.1 NAD(P)/FAD-dependent oxidoreductase [Domibacillus sp. PGB-M46]